MKDIAMLNKAPLDFFGCNFCLVEKHRMAFVLISKCGLTFLENIAIYASIGSGLEGSGGKTDFCL